MVPSVNDSPSRGHKTIITSNVEDRMNRSTGLRSVRIGSNDTKVTRKTIQRQIHVIHII